MQQRNFFLTLLMATVMMVFSPQITRAAVETVTVGEGTSSSYTVPYNSGFTNSTSQMLYTADEIGKKGIIQSIAFYVSNAYKFRCYELKIYMGETDLTQLSRSDAFTSNGLQLVYSGTDELIGSASGWETMTLSTPFDYSGEKNLVVVVCRKSPFWTLNLKYGCSNGKSLYRRSDDNNYSDIDDKTTYQDTDMRAAAQFQIKTCDHELIEHAAAPNTCGDDGNTLYYECSICHHYFSDAAAENEVEENSWVIPADPSQHEFTGNYDNNGFGQCAVCNKTLYNIYEPAGYDDEENCFRIYNVGQLYWFADKVNNGTSSDKGYPFNAEVYGNLVVNSNVLTDEGELNGDGSNFLAWTPIDNYQGVFNGAGSTIKGLYGGVGLFNNNNGTVTNVGIEDSYFEGDNPVGGIVAYNAGTVENSLSLATVKGNSNVGGLVGCNAANGVVKNCHSRATVKAETTDATRYGKVVGYNEGTLANCYYLSDVADQQETAHPTVISKTAEQFASGEVAWLLNGEKVDETSVWGQFLGNDDGPAVAFPSPSKWYFVWKGYMCFDDSLQYANHHLHSEPNHDHVYDNGICEVCGAYQTPESQTTGGVLTFDIANYGNALYVAKYTNEGNTCAARLVVPKVMMTGNYAYLTISNGTLTLDLNGDTLTTTNAQVILVAGGDVTITDSSEGQTGTIKNLGGHAVYAPSGSLAITGGTFIGGSGYAVYTSSSCDSLAISGGKYYAASGTARLYTPDKSALAPSYSYYNLRTGKELEDYTNQSIYVELSTDTVIVKQASVKAVLTKNGENINYYSFNSAIAAAQQCTANDNATLKLMKNRTMPSSKGYITLSSGTFTLDLNGDTISNCNDQTILVSGANLTITDSSEGQTGTIKNLGAHAVNAQSGSLAITGGTFIGGTSGYAVQTSPSCVSLAISGGKYYLTDTTSRLYTPDKSALAPGYSYYNLRTGEELEDYTNQPIFTELSTDTVIVKQASVKAVLTKNGENINYYSFNSAIAAAQQCTANDNATLKLMKNRTMPSSKGYITLSSGTFTLDLNGDTISNCNDQTILVSGANLTITDSSEGQTGTIKNLGAHAVNAQSGSLIITGGTFIGSGGYSIYNDEEGMNITLLSGSYNGGIHYHANSTLDLPNVAMFDTEGNEIALEYTEYVDLDYNCYRTEKPFTVNPYYTVGDVKGKLTKVDNKYFADKLTLVDGMPFSSEYDFTAAEAEYSRTMTTKWGTICLPFDVTVSSVTDKTEEGYQPFNFYYVDDINDDVMTLSKETQKVSAGTGMILRHDGTGGEVSIKETKVEVSSNAVCASNATDLWGTFTGKTINMGYYIANDKFWNAANREEGAEVPPYRAYVAGSGWAAAKGISILDPEEGTTGVTTVTADKTDADAWYTLDGVKLGAKPNKAGIYIHGGKKVAVK